MYTQMHAQDISNHTYIDMNKFIHRNKIYANTNIEKKM